MRSLTRPLALVGTGLAILAGGNLLAFSRYPFLISPSSTPIDAPAAEPLFLYPDGFAPPLEFVHITKTAGSAIEAAAARANIRWGVCHWKGVDKWKPGCRKRRKGEPKKEKRPHRPNIPELYKAVRGEPWHVPPQWFRQHPYRNQTSGPGGGPALFCVVRDPYERVVSEYHCPFGGYKEKKRYLGKRDDPRTLNRWVRRKLQAAPDRMHRLPQHLYVWNEQGERVVEHALRHEDLAAEFARLMGRYNLTGVRLPAKKINVRDTGKSQLTVEDLTDETIVVINDFYEEDFRRFNYTMKVVTS